MLCLEFIFLLVNSTSVLLPQSPHASRHSTIERKADFIIDCFNFQTDHEIFHGYFLQANAPHPSSRLSGMFCFNGIVCSLWAWKTPDPARAKVRFDAAWAFASHWRPLVTSSWTPSTDVGTRSINPRYSIEYIGRICVSVRSADWPFRYKMGGNQELYKLQIGPLRWRDERAICPPFRRLPREGWLSKMRKE